MWDEDEVRSHHNTRLTPNFVTGLMLHIVLHQPEIPQNTGNIGRTCVALGAKLWLVRPLGFRMDGGGRKRAGLDYWEHLDWQIVDHWAHLLEHLPTDRMWFFSKTATQDYRSPSYQADDVLVFGSETQGLPRAILDKFPEQALRIPMQEPVRSLNLAVAVGVAGYAACTHPS